MHEGSHLQGRGEDLDHGGEAVAFVATQIFAGAAQWEEGRRNRSRGPVIDSGGIREAAARLVGDPAGVAGFFSTLEYLKLAALGDGGGGIKYEGTILIGGTAESDGIGTEHGLDAEGGRNGWASVGEAHAEHALFNGHHGVVAINAKMGRVAHSDRAHAVDAGFINGQLHSLRGNDHAHAVMAVNEGGSRTSRTISNWDFGLIWPERMRLIYRLEAANAVRFNTAQVRGDEDFRADSGIFSRDTGFDKYIRIKDCRISTGR